VSAAARAKELREQLSYHGHRYYVLDDPEIGDDAYDALLDELRTIERDHPELVTPDSPTQRVGGEPVSSLQKVRHLRPMLSLANARSEEELRAWVTRMRSHLAREGIEDPDLRFVAEPKIDGLAISLLYRDGVLVDRGRVVKVGRSPSGDVLHAKTVWECGGQTCDDERVLRITTVTITYRDLEDAGISAAEFRRRGDGRRNRLRVVDVREPQAIASEPARGAGFRRDEGCRGAGDAERRGHFAHATGARSLEES